MIEKNVSPPSTHGVKSPLGISPPRYDPLRGQNARGRTLNGQSKAPPVGVGVNPPRIARFPWGVPPMAQEGPRDKTSGFPRRASALDAARALKGLDARADAGRALARAWGTVAHLLRSWCVARGWGTLAHVLQVAERAVARGL